MSQLPTVADVLDETAALNGLARRHNGFHLEPRCRVCRNDTLRIKVNDLLASGASYAMILRALGEDNAEARQARPGHDRFDPQPHQAALPGAERREGDLPRNPGAAGRRRTASTSSRASPLRSPR